MPRANVSGTNIYYEVHGQGEPLVMIMGLSLTRAEVRMAGVRWAPAARSLFTMRRKICSRRALTG